MVSPASAPDAALALWLHFGDPLRGTGEFFRSIGTGSEETRPMSTRAELINYYSALPDDQLMRIALHEAGELTPVAIEVMKAEIRTRRLGKPLEEAIEAQTNSLSPEEQQELVERFRRLPCPICGATRGLLNAVMVATARSFLIMTLYETRLVVGCSQCIVAASRRASNLTWALGWWGIPWGPMRVLQASSINAKANSTAHATQATESLRRYVAENHGAVVFRLRQHESCQSNDPSPVQRKL
jgi:hypothetical protein